MSAVKSATTLARVEKILPTLDSIVSEQLTKTPKLNTYFVPRTTQGNLPVYRTYRSQAVYTDIKRVRGNVVQLRNDLQQLLPEIPKERFNCYTITGSLRIKGDYSSLIKQVLGKKF